MNKIKKKGLSPIFATVLLILLTISAATFIASFIYKFVNSEMEKTRCHEYVDYFNFDSQFGYNCFENSGNSKNYKISLSAKNVKNESAKEVIGFGLIFFKEGDSKGVEALDGQEYPDFKMLSNSTKPILIPKSGETRTYNYTDNQEYSSVKVYAILNTRKCEAVESTSLQLC